MSREFARIAIEHPKHREKNMSTLRAIKVLDYALQTEEGADNCVKFVEDLGLSSLFSAFMGKVRVASQPYSTD